MTDLALKKVAVIGAAGKMGSGISSLLLTQMAPSEDDFFLYLIDSDINGLISLIKKLKKQLIIWSEKNINRLRQIFVDQPMLVSNAEMIEAFVDSAMERVIISTETTQARFANLVFEAIVEDLEVKAEVISTIDRLSDGLSYYFSNTSSIPIESLAKVAHVEGRLIGFHFYNPPAVQKLLEIICPQGLDPKLKELALRLAKALGKTVVESKDVAGFIGNGHFMREIAFSLKEAQKLEKDLGLMSAICAIDLVTRDLLLRPMGIFQLIDYVGLDVCQKVMAIMKISSTDLIDQMVAMGITGGQHSDGSQKNGFFEYRGKDIVAVCNLKTGDYEPLVQVDLGFNPPQGFSWKALHKRKDFDASLKDYFNDLFASDSFGANLAKRFLLNSQKIVEGLVSNGIAKTEQDVNQVLKLGFYHLYSSIPQEVKQ